MQDEEDEEEEEPMAADDGDEAAANARLDMMQQVHPAACITAAAPSRDPGDAGRMIRYDEAI